jgi:hypothetical protein
VRERRAGERKSAREREREGGRDGGRERGPAVKDEEAASQTPRSNNASNCRRKESVKFNFALACQAVTRPGM